MISPAAFYRCLLDYGIDFFSGVPDSLLKDFCAYVADHSETGQHVICANEGNAIAMATGYYLATGKPALVYMQNSGLGNALNPLLSLTDKEVYGIPMLLLIGWRGESNIKDEPQHVKQGRVQNALLKAAEIPYYVICGDNTDYDRIIVDAIDESLAIKNPVAIIVRKGTFEEYTLTHTEFSSDNRMFREEAISLMLDYLKDCVIISTTGKTSRELFELRVKRNDKIQDFLTVGSMGHSSSIAAAIALQKPDKRVVCFDGDGTLIMHMGSLAVIGNLAPTNYIHVLLNNQCHESVGGQKTASASINFGQLSLSVGFRFFFQVTDPIELGSVFLRCQKLKGPLFIEVLIKKGSRKDLGRPTSSPAENKASFMDKLKSLC